MVPTFDGTDRADGNLVASHLASSSVLVTVLLDVQSGTCAVGLYVLLTAVAVDLVGFCPDFHTDLPSANQKALAVEYRPRKLELLPASGFIGGEYLPSHDKGHIVPKARLNHDFLTPLAQDIPYSRYHFLHRCHSSRTRQMWYVTTNTSLNPDPGITL